MATPLAIASGAAATSQVMKRFISTGTAEKAIKVLCATVLWSTTWQIDTTHTSNGIDAGDLAWDTDHTVLTLEAGYTKIPQVQATPAAPGAYRVSVDYVSETEVHLYWYTGTTLVTTEDANMAATILVLGE